MFFNFFEQQEKLNTAMDVINSDKRTQTLFNARNTMRMQEKVIALLVAMLLAGLVVINLPKYKDTPDGKKLEQRRLEQTSTPD